MVDPLAIVHRLWAIHADPYLNVVRTEGGNPPLVDQGPIRLYDECKIDDITQGRADHSTPVLEALNPSQEWFTTVEEQTDPALALLMTPALHPLKGDLEQIVGHEVGPPLPG